MQSSNLVVIAQVVPQLWGFNSWEGCVVLRGFSTPSGKTIRRILKWYGLLCHRAEYGGIGRKVRGFFFLIFFVRHAFER